MTERAIPEKPENSFRVTIEIAEPRNRLDQILMEELRKQDRNLLLKKISRAEFKDLFRKKRIHIKGQPARPASSLARGTTYVDVLGFKESDQ